MVSLHSPRVETLSPYVPGEQAPGNGWIKLNTNENPYPPSPAAIAAIAAAAADGLERYPDPQAAHLRAAIAQYHGVPLEQVFAGNGSDEVLALAFCAFFQHGVQPLLMADVTYGFYEVYCRLFGIRCAQIAVGERLRLDLDGFAALGAADAGIAGIVIANPNAPTGECLPLERVQRLLEIQPRRLVLVDEAYVDFGGQSAIALVEQYPNLLVVQTLSKSRALAGLRVGFAIGQAPLIAALERVKNSFNSYPLGRLAQAGAAAAFQDRAYFEETRQAIIGTRTLLCAHLRLMGFEVLPSQANFLFVRHPRFDALSLAAGLRDAKILVRHFPRPRVEQYLRISVGTEEQAACLVRALRAQVQP
ncbi:histidinol-phosphate transaminase [Achromobacter aegrifaciens]|uniref:histidinol-phosphate transaminase n=1 Tax=Achromobacter aegrifaciens TaxID=1287736 RepID=UPI0027B93F08|nr:histidinol-phosphate transaminase [Achromobacter aegrifaciens]WLW62547.1 histidinol-phosphate transaminase [Achromobacter aegrifaciens]